MKLNSFNLNTPKINIRSRHSSYDSARLESEIFKNCKGNDISLNAYYYNDEGKISYNPLPYKFITTHADSPLRYRDPGSKHIIKPKKSMNTLFSTQTNFDTGLSRDMHFLDQSIWSKEVFVMKDGTTVMEGEQLLGFTYQIQNDFKNKIQQQIEFSKFFEKCNQEIKSRKKLKFLFTSSGKILRSLSEIPRNAKVVIVSDKSEFIGLVEASICAIKTERNSLDTIRFREAPKFKSANRLSLCETEIDVDETSVSDLVESRFASRDLGFSSCHRRKGVLTKDFKQERKDAINSLRKRSAKHFLKPIKAKEKPKVKLEKYQILNNLKVSMGRAALKIDQDFPKLDQQGIPQLMKKFNFSEANLHKLYAQFKTLVLLSLSNDTHHDIQTGVKRSTFVENFKKGSEQGGMLLGRIFDTIDVDGDGCVNWEEFVKAMSVITYGTHEQQIEMFFQIYDEDHSGGLSFDEIKHLCKFQLHFAIQDEIIDYLAEAFAKTIFEMVGVSQEKIITQSQLKGILTQQKEKNLIEMFCSFNLL